MSSPSEANVVTPTDSNVPGVIIVSENDAVNVPPTEVRFIWLLVPRISRTPLVDSM